MSVPCRCRLCGARHAFKKHPALYVRGRKCKRCGSPDFKVDKHRQNGKEKGRQRCDCGGLHFPHRWSSKGCVHSETPCNWEEHPDYRPPGYENEAPVYDIFDEGSL